ncbi:hypothetical protein D0T49_05405 [Paludibacter sp. 221]|uniref:hypothetical protein n=1 Tax=Paludibacter sp. 221 TaxID=2302939 RepID=UPI0013D50443|nr:hypothetical protein [Paludibacter sp. 221]NDV46477.1 hypothetical protein [Paludibacter sp. 221]
MKVFLKKSVPHLIALLIFVVLTVVYFAPSVFQNKTIQQGDVVKYIGMSEEVRNYAKTEESKDFPVIGWTGSMFSGMPTYTISTQKGPRNFLSYLEAPIKAIDEGGTSMVLMGLICFYILMCVMGANFWLALAGSIAFAFASYNIIIIEAGHINKAYVIAYMPLTIAGMLLVFRKKWLVGSMLTILGVALSFKGNHIQVTYYLAILCVVLFLGYMFSEFRKKDFVAPAKVAGIFAACIVIAVLPSLGTLYSNYELSKESIRGASELTAETTGSTDKASSGLDIDYAFAWSYGKAETMTLLIPNFYGGVTGGELSVDSELGKAMKAHRIQTGKKIQTATYWGDQPFTSGPVYFGALVCFLFLLGMFVIKNPIKWWILGGTLFFVFLSWGRNFMFFNEFLFHYLPMYSKFRTVSMSLVIPGLTFPIIGIWGLMLILSQKVDKKKLLKSFYWSLGITGGLCLVFWIMPGVFLDFTSANDMQYQFPDWYYNALLKDRESLLKKDAFRSLMFILLGAALIFWFIKSKNAAKVSKYAAIGITLLIFVDLWTVDKRYVNYDKFMPEKSVSSFKKTNADKFILQDTDASYRVLNLNNTFQESYTAYYHKSIGGYNAAKLRRYQELIDYRITGEMRSIKSAFQNVKTYEDLENMDVFSKTPTLNMLNTRYVIFDTEQPPIMNPQAYGNAWFVENYSWVENADEELAALYSINPLETAVIDQKFADKLNSFKFEKDEDAEIELLTYEPVRLRYRSSAGSDQLAVFSEVYYPHGWEATIDGKPAEHFRVDWTLRGMIVPAGEHEIEFNFLPKAYIAAARIGSVSSVLIILLLVFALGWTVKTGFKEEKK